MSQDSEDQRLWEAVVAAERELARRRADFHQQAATRSQVLRSALTGGSSWHQAAALSFLQAVPTDVPDLLEELVALALSHSHARSARRAVEASRQQVLPEIDRIVARRLPTADADDFRRYAELLAHLGSWGSLGNLVGLALESRDADIREVGEDFAEAYGHALGSADS